MTIYVLCMCIFSINQLLYILFIEDRHPTAKDVFFTVITQNVFLSYSDSFGSVGICNNDTPLNHLYQLHTSISFITITHL